MRLLTPRSRQLSYAGFILGCNKLWCNKGYIILFLFSILGHCPARENAAVAAAAAAAAAKLMGPGGAALRMKKGKPLQKEGILFVMGILKSIVHVLNLL
jgi:hypothetical protein